MASSVVEIATVTGKAHIRIAKGHHILTTSKIARVVSLGGSHTKSNRSSAPDVARQHASVQGKRRKKDTRIQTNLIELTSATSADPVIHVVDAEFNPHRSLSVIKEHAPIPKAFIRFE